MRAQGRKTGENGEVKISKDIIQENLRVEKIQVSTLNKPAVINEQMNK